MPYVNIPLEHKEALAAPHVEMGHFMMVDLPDGVKYYYEGMGTPILPLDGVDREWVGLSNPGDDKLVSFDRISDPRFEYASAYQVTLSSVTGDLYKQIVTNPQNFEGRPAHLYMAIFNQETGKIIGDFVDLFPGYITSPRTLRQGVEVRACRFTFVSEWDVKNFPFAGRWTDADHQKRHPGDKFFQYASQSFDVRWE